MLGYTLLDKKYEGQEQLLRSLVQNCLNLVEKIMKQNCFNVFGGGFADLF